MQSCATKATRTMSLDARSRWSGPCGWGRPAPWDAPVRARDGMVGFDVACAHILGWGTSGLALDTRLLWMWGITLQGTSRGHGNDKHELRYTSRTSFKSSRICAELTLRRRWWP
jgi:hypothetical protein